MKKDATLFLEHILESIELIEEYVKDKTLEDFSTTNSLQDMVIRRLEIIGEAVKNIDNDFRDMYKNIPWKQIAGMRDKLIHEYFGVDLVLTWAVVEKELPDLKKKIIEIIK